MKRIRTSRLTFLSRQIPIISFLYFLSILTLADHTLASPAEVNGRILVTYIGNSKVSVVLQINTTSGLEAMGGATIILAFDTSAISFVVNPVRNDDYIFHNFCGGNYSPATVTRPTENRLWVNIDLPFQNNNKGTIVSGNGSWTDVVTINFDVLNPDGLLNIFWLCSSPFWGVYDDDNISTWNTGQFEDALNIPLPVELSSFTAKQVADKVELNWVTETEINNYGFDVERKVNKGKWIVLGFVRGSGNSSIPHSYSFIDDDLTGGSRFYYRLKQIDTDGNYEYSEMVEVVYTPDQFLLYQNYPNPFNPSTKIKYSVGANCNSPVQIKVYDVLGHEVATLVNEEKQPGVYEIEFSVGQSSPADSPDLSSGIYFYNLQAGSYVETKKMLLIK